MQQLRKYKINDPQERIDRLLKLLQKISSSKVLKDWNLKLAPNLAKFKGHKLIPAKVEKPGSQ